MGLRLRALPSATLLCLCQPALAQAQSLLDFPPDAGAKGEHGTVRLQMDVAENGQIVGCKVVRPSGAPDLDDRVCKAAAHGSFPPSGSSGMRSIPLVIHYVVPGQQITDADLPIGSGEAVIMFNPARDETQRRYGVTGPGKAHMATQLATTKSPAYPREAMAAGHEGTVYAAVTVSKDGKPASCELVRSSGYADLDQGTCSYIMTNFRYEPGTDYYGKRMKDYALAHINWKIK